MEACYDTHKSPKILFWHYVMVQVLAAVASVPKGKERDVIEGGAGAALISTDHPCDNENAMPLQC